MGYILEIERFRYRRGDFPVTKRLEDVSLALPFSCVMTEDQVDYVCTNLLDILKRKKKSVVNAKT